MTHTSAVVRSSNLADFSRFAILLDLDPVALMRRAGIHERYLDDPELKLPVRAISELLEISAKASGIEDFGLRLGEVRGLPDFGPAMLMLREEPTVRDAVRTLVAFLHLHSDAFYPHFEDCKNPILSIDFIGSGPAYYRQTVDATVASFNHIFRWLLGDDWTPELVCLKHSRPATRANYDRFFRCPIAFEHEYNGLVLRQRDLDKALPGSAPALRRQIARYVRSIDIASDENYVHRVMQMVTMALPRGEAKAENIAHYLDTNRRTLHERLARVGLNYSEVVESIREELAAQHLLSSDRPLTDIAGLIGFGSLSAFTQWFRRSFDCAPSEWRKKQKGRNDQAS